MGGIIGGIASAATAMRAAQVWLKIIEMHGYAWNAVQAIVGLCAGYLGLLEGLKAQPLPSASYDHPGV